MENILDIQKIATQQTLLVRQSVLRIGKPIDKCYLDNDDLATTIHYGYFLSTEIIGILSVFVEKNLNFTEKNQVQFRGMAVLNKFQSKGIGKKLIQFAEKEAIENKIELIWLNARKLAVPFYENLGYQIIGNSFEVPEIGTHFVMYKKII